MIPFLEDLDKASPLMKFLLFAEELKTGTNGPCFSFLKKWSENFDFSFGKVLTKVS